MANDIVTAPFPEAQAAIARRVQELMDAIEAKDADRLEAYHLFGPKYSKFDEGQPAERQDAATAQQIERAALAAATATATALRFRAEDLKVDVFGPVAVATFVVDWATTMPDGQEDAARSRATLVFVDVEGAWKIVHEHISAFPTAA